MRSCIRLPSGPLEPLPAHLAGDDVRFPPALVHHFLEEFTRPGDVVFDPFAGFGTTLVVAESLGRRACGVELDAARVAFARQRLRRPEALVHGDSRRLETYGLPAVDCCFTSIPYCTQEETSDPLTWYAAPGKGYHAYLADLQSIFRQVVGLLRAGAITVVEVANLRDATRRAGPVTTLAWDVGRALSAVLRFEGEVVVDWEPTYGYGYDHSYCLVFRPPPGSGRP
ncbi:MAG TPA: DNA methyltransferase [Chloroflexota bacterium]|jgi:hypothetical protein|nr:DNA methyltransferase [Chloroflexota bacterium]